MYQTWNYNACKGYRIKQNTEGNFFFNQPQNAKNNMGWVYGDRLKARFYL